MSRKIAFVHYPHGPKNARLETMPFAYNTVLYLARAGWQVDLYVWEKPLFGKVVSSYDKLLPETVKTHYLTESRLNLTYHWRHIWYKIRFSLQQSYSCVFGVGQIGAYIGNLLSKSSNCPFIQIVDEFPSSWGTTRWTELEKLAAREAAMLIIPDKQHAQFLSKELELPSDKLYCALPNVAIAENIPESIDWHDRLGLPESSIPFLYAGTVSISPWGRIPELLSTVPDWPEPAVLVIHSRSQKEIETFRKSFSHLEMKNRIFWSSTPLELNELNSLVAHCEGNFALYHNAGPHIEYAGFSAGKLMRSLACGSPVIASNLTSFKFVQEHDLGILINDEQEIPLAVKQIMGQRERYRTRCLDFCKTHASFEVHWPDFCTKMLSVTGIDLQKPC